SHSLLAQVRRRLVRRPRLESRGYVGRQASQLFSGAAFARFLLGHWDIEPTLERGVNPLAVFRADVVAVGAFGRLAGELATAVRKCQAVRRFIEAVNLLEPCPDGIALAVP